MIFIAGNLPMVSEIAPLMMEPSGGVRLRRCFGHRRGDAGLISFVLLLIINKLQAWSWARIGGAAYEFMSASPEVAP